MRIRGREGVKKFQNFADVIYGWHLCWLKSCTVECYPAPVSSPIDNVRPQQRSRRCQLCLRFSSPSRDRKSESQEGRRTPIIGVEVNRYYYLSHLCQQSKVFTSVVGCGVWHMSSLGVAIAAHTGTKWPCCSSDNGKNVRPRTRNSTQAALYIPRTLLDGMKADIFARVTRAPGHFNIITQEFSHNHCTCNCILYG